MIFESAIGQGPDFYTKRSPQLPTPSPTAALSTTVPPTSTLRPTAPCADGLTGPHASFMGLRVSTPFRVGQQELFPRTGTRSLFGCANHHEVRNGSKELPVPVKRHS
jgi:hypothetical protein